MYLSSYNGYGYSDKAKYCMRCPEKAAVTVKQENKKWIFKFSMVDWGVFIHGTLIRPEPETP